MPGLTGRMSTVVKAKVSKLLDRAEDPAETLDYSYQKQLELLQNVKRGIADVVTSKKRIQLQEATLQQQIVKLDTQARQALAAGQEDLAKIALERKQNVQTELQSLDQQVAELEDQQAKLTDSERKLRTKIEAFRTKKEVIKAQYSAAEAQVRISEAATGVGEQMADVGLAMQRAIDKTENMKARAGAVQELEASGHVRRPDGAGVGQGRHRSPARRALDVERRRRRAGEDEGRARRPAVRRGQLESHAGDGAGGLMIVRILNEDQYRLPEDLLGQLNELDNACVEAVEAGDEPRFRATYDQLLALSATAARCSGTTSSAGRT